jgi:hypothetical protein
MTKIQAAGRAGRRGGGMRESFSGLEQHNQRELAEGGAIGSDESFSPLRPLLEGARARGVADACQLLGYPCVLLDASGGVLHASDAARALLAGDLRLTGGHLVAADAQANHRIEQLVEAALSGAVSEVAIAAGAAASGDLFIRALPLPGAQDDEAQLLKAVLLLSRATA